MDDDVATAAGSTTDAPLEGVPKSIDWDRVGLLLNGAEKMPLRVRFGAGLDSLALGEAAATPALAEPLPLPTSKVGTEDE